MISERQINLIESVRKHRFSKAIWKDSGLTYDKFHSSMQELTRRKLIKRVAQATYEIDEEQIEKNMIKGRLYQEKEEVTPDEFTYDLNTIPEDVREWIWENRNLPCTQIRKHTGLNRFYIRQYLYERKNSYEERTKHFSRVPDECDSDNESQFGIS